MPLSNKSIVAIDDAHPILNFLRISLESLGVRFYSATTASGGLLLCEKYKPDLIVLDLGLPDAEGFDIMPSLRALDIPVIVLTVRNSQEDRDKAFDLGAVNYLTKPFAMGKFLSIICDALHIQTPLFPSVSGILTDENVPYAIMQSAAI